MYAKKTMIKINGVNFIKKDHRKPQITVMLHYCATIKKQSGFMNSEHTLSRGR